MQLGVFFRILRARFWLIASILFVTLASAAVGTAMMTKVYSSSAVIYVDVKSLDPVLGGAVYSPQTVRGILATQADVIQSDRVAYAVIQEAGLDKRPDIIEAWRRDTGGQGDILTWLSKGLRKALEVTASNEGSTLTIAYEDRDPEEAAKMANAFADRFVETTLALRAAPARKSAEYFEAQINAYRDRLQEARARMSAFQQSSGIVATDERLDIENQRLQELSSQLVAVQAIATESRSRRDAIAREGRESMPEVVQNQLLQSLKTELSRAEGKLQELSARLGPNHPQYRSARAEVEALRARVDAEIDKVSRSIVASSTVNAQREAEIRRALDAQRARVLRLKQDHDQLDALSRQVDEAQKALELVSQRLTQTNLESQAPQSNVSILSPALPPSEPSRPKPRLNMVVGAFVGLLLGVLAALSLEALKRPVRSTDDLLHVTQLPVLAVLPPSGSRRAQRLIGGTGPSIAPPNLRLGN
ncbi:MAG: chain length determinant protein EpsF [Burkholderiaceae bacterium]|nr:chain length determinant protein EpsF [Burkholderiaceae bacterium]